MIAVQFGGVGRPAARLAFAEAAVIDELDVEPAERRRRLEHLALDMAGAIPARLTARRRIERKDQPAAPACRTRRRGALEVAQERIDLGVTAPDFDVLGSRAYRRSSPTA